MMLPRSVPVSAILPPEDSGMGRDSYQELKLRKTKGKRPKWYAKYAVNEISGPGTTKRVEKRAYFGLCSEVGKREAERLRDAFRNTVNQPKHVILESQVPMSNWIRTYESTFIPTLKPNTQTQYRAYCGVIERRFGNVRLCDINTNGIQLWLNELAPTRTKRALEYVLAVFSSLMETASDYGYRDAEMRNPCAKVRLPYGGRTSTVDLRALTPDEMRRLLAIADAMDTRGVKLGDVLRIGLFCGLRVGEMLALQWGDVQPPVLYVSKSRSQQTGEITTPKSQSGRRAVALGPVVLKRPEGATDRDRVFDVEYEGLRKRLKRLFVDAGITMNGTTFHVLRRTYATMRRNAGAGSLREAMGHSTEAMSMVYVRESFADDEAAANRMAALVMGETTGRKQ